MYTHLSEKIQNKKNIVFVSGNFNILHPGHLRLLRFAAECGDHLIVGVLSDKLAKGVFLNEHNRMEAVSALSLVDDCIILTEPPEDFISKIKPSIVVKGREHENAANTELDAVNKYGGKLLFSSGESTFSSFELIKNEIAQINFTNIEKPLGFPARHGFSDEIFLSVIEDIKKINVCVIGDTIIDEYVGCDPVGMSQEDPTIVVKPIMTETFVGGASIVASHAKCMGANVNFITVTGDDKHAEKNKKYLVELGVNVSQVKDSTRPTTCKRRYRAGGKTLLRVNEFSQQAISKSVQDQLYDEFCEIADNIDLLIFSDFNYGILPLELIDKIITQLNKRNIIMVADSQCSSQVGDVSRYTGMTLLTPTEREARYAVRDFQAGLVTLAETLQKNSKAKNIIMTLGAEGILIHAGNNKDGWLTDKLPALNRTPKDPAGAGDALMVCAAMALTSGRNIWEAAYFGSLAAACQISRVGNIPLTADEMRIELNQ